MESGAGTTAEVSGPRRRTFLAPLLGTFAVCLVVHLALLLQYRGTPFAEFPVSDALSYHEWAVRIAEQGLAVEPVFHQSPLFPVLLGWTYGIAGEAHRGDAALVLQIVLTCLAITLLVPLGRAYLGSTGAGLIAAAIALLHAPFAFHALKLLPLPLALATQALALLALVRAREQPSALISVGAGLALGLATAARAELLLFVPLAFGWMLGSPAARGRGYRPAAFLLVGTLLAISPITLHNLLRGDRVLVASAAGENLYIGNQRGADGGHTPLHPQAGDLFSQRVLAERIAEQARGRDLRPSEISVYWRNRALGDVLAAPGEWLRLESRKLGRVLHPGDPTDMYSIAAERANYLPLLHLLPLPYWTILVFGIAGLVYALRLRPGRVAPLAALVGLHLGVLLIFFVSTRLRLPLIFFLTLFAGFAVREGARLWLRGRKRRLSAAVALVALLAGFVSIVSTRAAPRDLVRLSSVLTRQDRNDDALRVLGPALAGEDADPIALDQAGWIFDRTGEMARAREHYLRALDRGLEGSRAAQCRTRLAMVLERLDDLPGAALQHDAAVAGKWANAWNYYERGMFRLRIGDSIGARMDIVQANRLNPHWPPAREALDSLP